MSTLFTKIINGELPSDKVYEDDQVCAFRDINPAAPTHILIVPRKEVATVDDLADDDGALVGKMILVARDLAWSEGSLIQATVSSSIAKMRADRYAPSTSASYGRAAYGADGCTDLDLDAGGASVGQIFSVFDQQMLYILQILRT